MPPSSGRRGEQIEQADPGVGLDKVIDPAAVSTARRNASASAAAIIRRSCNGPAVGDQILFRRADAAAVIDHGRAAEGQQLHLQDFPAVMFRGDDMAELMDEHDAKRVMQFHEIAGHAPKSP